MSIKYLARNIHREDFHGENIKCYNCCKRFKPITFNHKFCCINCREKFSKKIRKSKYKGKFCFICDKINNLEEHHIIRRVDGGKETIWLCKEHHTLIHKFMYMLDSLGCEIVKIKL